MTPTGPLGSIPFATCPQGARREGVLESFEKDNALCRGLKAGITRLSASSHIYHSTEMNKVVYIVIYSTRRTSSKY